MQVASGWVGVVTTRGVSMQPTYQQDDLVVTRRSDSYGVGDIIAYRSAELSEEVVLHRVIDTDADTFITQGDSNDWVDRDRPTTTDVVGEAWFHIPGGGRFIAPLRRLGPVVAVGAFLLVAFSFAGSSRNDRPSRKRRTVPAVTDQLLARNAPLWLTGVAAGAALLCATAYTAPATVAATDTVEVTHDGAFSYTAAVDESIVYPDGVIGTGDPVFRSTTDSLELRYEHEVDAPDPVKVSSGVLSGDVVVAIDAWEHILESLEEVELVDGRGELATTIVFADVDAIAERYEKVSGRAPSQLQVHFRPEVEAGAGAGAAPTATSVFETSMTVGVGPSSVDVAAEGLDVTGSDPVEVPVTEPRQIAAFGRSIDADQARAVGPAVLAAAVLLLLATAFTRRRAPASAPIHAAAKGRLVPVDSLSSLEGAIDVLDAQAFTRIAQAEGALVLHSTGDDGSETFVVEDRNARYRYTTRPPRRATDAA